MSLQVIEHDELCLTKSDKEPHKTQSLGNSRELHVGVGVRKVTMMELIPGSSSVVSCTLTSGRWYAAACSFEPPH